MRFAAAGGYVSKIQSTCFKLYCHNKLSLAQQRQSRNTQSVANYLFLQLLQCINNWAAANTGGGHIGRRAREKRAAKYIKVVTTKENEDGKNAAAAARKIVLLFSSLSLSISLCTEQQCMYHKVPMYIQHSHRAQQQEREREYKKGSRGG